MRMKFSYVLAAGLAAGIGAWMYSGTVVIGGVGDSEQTPPPSLQVSESHGQDNLFKVQVAPGRRGTSGCSGSARPDGSRSQGGCPLPDHGRRRRASGA
jgi:hypothetical protein